MSHQIGVAGATKSGKTVFIASLLRAALAGANHCPFMVRPSNNEADALLNASTDILQGINPPATMSTQKFEFAVDLCGSFLFGLGRQRLSLCFADPPGGNCLPAQSEGFDPIFLETLRDSDTLLLVIPGDRGLLPPDLQRRTLDLFDQVRALKGRKRGQPLFTRVAVTLTMSELLIPKKSTNPVTDIETLHNSLRKNPLHFLAPITGEIFVKTIRSVTGRGGDWYFLTSAFGFDSATKDIAATQDNGSWRLKTSRQGFLDTWTPYRVFEPLEFPARGYCRHRAFTL